MNIRLFDILEKMGVNLKRQPNINPDGVCSTGETDKFLRTYMGYYKLFGKIRKTQLKQKQVDENGDPVRVEFRETEQDAFVQYTVEQTKADELTVDFFIECERK
ncbi:MAG: hypothetical protein RIG68_23280 [Imperialibacter sp.]|uniref:hypothetical protein n=1 Tax=Imperialibacter sp. TaxID=2038411 RepID=UPI0032EBFC79